MNHFLDLEHLEPRLLLAATIFPCRQWDVGEGPVSVYAGDLDGDDLADLAVVHRDANSMSILLNMGGGLFEPAADVVLSGGPVSIAGADFDGDDDVDLAVLNGDGDNVSVLLNDGAGNFAAPTDYTVGADPVAMVLAHLNTDDVPDLVTVNETTNEVAVALGDGAGGVGAAAAYTVGHKPMAVTVGDLDGDGHLDLLSAETGIAGGTVTTLRNDGAGGFTPVGSYRTDWGTRWIAAADFNEDGALDAVTLDSSYMALLLGGGDGTLGPYTLLTEFNYGSKWGVSVSAVATADVNADGHADVLVTLRDSSGSPVYYNTHSLGVRLGNGDGTFELPTRSPAGEEPLSPQVADFDGNGILDVAVANNAGVGTVTVLEGHGDGTFGARWIDTSPIADSVLSVYVGDLDNDGHADLATINDDRELDVHLGQGDGTFGEPVESAGSMSMYARTIRGGDADGDGLVDLFVGGGNSPGGNEISLLRNLGGGAFEGGPRIVLQVNLLRVGVGHYPFQVADLDLDGDVDIAASYENNGQLAVARGNGDATFQREPLLLTVGDDPQAVWVGDFNADDWPDIACVNTAADTVSILFNTGNGTLDDDTFGAAVDYPAGDAPASLFGADFNHDNAIDLVTASEPNGSVSMLLNNGDGTFAAPTAYPVGFVAAPEPNAVTGADLNDDGHLDLAVSNSEGDAISVLLGLGDGTFGPARQYAAGADPRCITTADFNGDGRTDLAVADFEDDGALVLIQRPILWHSEIVSPRRSGEIVVGDALHFAGKGTVAVAPIAYAWDFGDGRTSDLDTPGILAFPTAGAQTVSFAVVDGNGGADPAPDTRTITVVPDDGTMPDLTISDVTAPSALAVGHLAMLEYDVRNDGDGDITGAAWLDALYLSDDPYITHDDVLVASVGIAVDLAVAEGYSRSLPFTVPHVAEGAYYLILAVDDDWQVLELHQLNNELASPVAVEVQELHDNVPVDSQFAIDSRRHHYRVEVEPGEHLVVRLDDADDQGVNELYLSHGEAPTRVAYDYRHGRPGEADQSIIVGSPAPGTWYVLAYGAERPGGDDYTIVADTTGVALTQVSPDRLGDTDSEQVTLDGAGFGPTTEVELLESDGTPHAAGAIDVEWPTRLVATFDTGALPAGLYGVRVSEPAGDTAQLDDVVEIIPGATSYFETNLVVPAVVGYHGAATIYVEYANTGELAMPAPLLHLTAEQEGRQGAVLSLDHSRLNLGFWTTAPPEGFSHSVQFLASGEQPGVLGPGESMRVPVYYVGWLEPYDFSYPPVDWRLTWIAADSDLPLDWASHKDTLQPDWAGDEAWEPIWANLTDQTGTTWGEYVTLLADNAAHLGRLGVSGGDALTLLSFELLQANGLGPFDSLGAVVDAYVSTPGLSLGLARSFATLIADRYETGPFGRGWSHNWQSTLQVAADGTVAIQEPASPPRVIQPDVRGGYLALPGDYATLEAVGSGAFTLTDIQGMVVAYRDDGKLDYREDTNGNRVTATYTGDLLTRLTHSSGQWLELAYNAADHIERVTDSEGGEVTYAYDAGDEHLLSVGYDDGRTINYTYSEHALTGVLQACGCGGNQYFTYDTRGRLTGTNRETGAEAITYAYDSAGTIIATDAAGGTTRLLYDHRGLVGQTIDADGHTTTTVHSALHGRAEAVIDPLGRAYTYDYDQAARLAYVTDPLGNTMAYTYTSSPDRVASVTDANGNAVEYSYDARGNLLATRYADNTVESYTRDAVGKVDTWTNRRDETVDLEYDAAGRVTAKIYPDSSRIDYTYDARGNLTSATDAAGMTELQYYANDYLRRITYGDGEWIQFTYTATGQRASVADSLGTQVFYAYDALGRLEQMTDPGGGTIVEYAYDAAGRLERGDMGSGVYTTYDHDPAGQLTQLINYAPDDSVLSRFDYIHDAIGQRTWMGTLDGEWTYEYDYVGQLVGAVFDSSNAAIADQDLSYEYDPLGNRIQTVVAGGQSVGYTANEMNQYETAGDTTYQYDDDGNLTAKITPAGATSYTYDIENRLVRVETAADTWEYVYDALGSRVATIHNGTETKYLVDPVGPRTVLAEYDAAGDLLTAYHHAYDILVARSDDAGTAQYYNFDGLGSTAELTDASGSVLNDYVFDPFGLPLQADEAVPNDFEFLGQWGITATGHGESFMRARYYDPASGRFNAQDPLGLRAGDANLYRYVGNSPVTRVDPSGTSPIDLVCKCRWEEVGPALCGYLRENLKVPEGWSVDCIYYEDEPESHYVEICDACDPPPPPPAPPGPWCEATGACDPFPPVPGWCEITGLCDDDDPPGGGGAGGASGTSGSLDPNQKLGPAGFGDAHYLADGRLLSYRIDFENDPAATAPAQYVTVTDQLAGDLDWGTFELTEVGFGDHFLTVPPGAQYFEAVEPMTYDGQDLNVHVRIAFDAEAGQIAARFMTLVAETGLPPDVMTGFLPPEDGTGRGMGYFTYVIEADQGLATGTEIRNIAVIQFDFGEIIATNQVDPHDPSQGTDPAKEALVTIDAGPPSSEVDALPAEVDDATFFDVTWSGQDDAGGSGIAGYYVYVATDGGDWERWLYTHETAATFFGESGHTYAFYSLAHDNVGHYEAAPTGGDGDTQTTVVATPPAIDVTDSSGADDDHSIQFTTARSDFDPAASDSTLVRPAYPDEKQYIVVTNTATSAVRLREIQIAAPDVTTVPPPLTDDPADDIVLQAGETQQFVLTYAPTRPSLADPTVQNLAMAAGLVIVSTAENDPACEIALHGASTYNSDITYDGIVNLSELGPLNVHYGKTSADADWDPTADITGDGIMNLEDLGPLNVEFGRELPEGLPGFGVEQHVQAGGSDINVDSYSVPALADWDSDGVADLIVGEKTFTNQGKVRVYINTGTAGVPAYDGYFYAQSSGVDLAISASGCLGTFPRVFDWDRDGLKDLIVGSADGTVQVFLNENTNAEPLFGSPTAARVGLPGSKVDINVGGRATLDIVDWNNDGRFDLVLGAYDGKIRVFLNESDTGEPDFRQEMLVLDGGSDLVVPTGRSSVAVADMNADGRKDLLLGNTEGQVLLYANIGTDLAPVFDGYQPIEADGEAIHLPASPRSRPFVGDYNDDGIWDLLVGAYDGLVRLYVGQG